MQQLPPAEDLLAQAHEVIVLGFNLCRNIHGYMGDMKEEYIVRVSFAGYLKFTLAVFCFCVMVGICCLSWHFVGDWMTTLFRATFKFEFRPHHHPTYVNTTETPGAPPPSSGPSWDEYHRLVRERDSATDYARRIQS